MFTLSDTIPGMKDLADRLIEARTEKGLTQGELAKEAGVSQSTIGNLESGLRSTARKLAVIAHVLGVNALWLETGNGPKRGIDPLSAQIAKLAPSQRNAVMAVVNSFVGAPAAADVALQDEDFVRVDEYKRRILGLIDRMNSRAKDDAEAHLIQVVREYEEHAFRESESTAVREKRERTVASKTHGGNVEQMPEKKRKS